MTELENRAHAQKALVSSDAVRYFMKVTGGVNRNEALDELVKSAHTSFTAENGWVVINLTRIEALMDTEEDEVTIADTKPITAGSLAEAIVTGNVLAAYEQIAHRPMIALADATADLDALYRFKNGEQTVISDMLMRESEALSAEAVKSAIAALTSALDGTYDSEQTAVKTAIMKAIKTLA